MGFGSAPAGNTTTTQVNPTAQAQLPFLESVWNNAKDIYNANPPSAYLNEGYQGIANNAQWINEQLRNPANNVYFDAAAGRYGVQNSPAYGGLNAFATGQAAPQQTYNTIQNAALAAGPAYAANISQYAPGLAGYAGQAAGPNTGTTALAGQSSYNNPAVSQLLAANPGTQALAGAAQGQGMGLNALANTASGAYLNSNPYLDATYRAAADPVTRAYQTSTAPTTDAAFSGGGRYGSGAAAGARDTNELNLGNTLANLSTNIYGQNYARERTAQDAAATNYQTLINQAGSQYGQLSNQAAGTAGQLINQAALNYGTLQNQGLDTALRGLTAAGGLQSAAGSADLAARTQALSAAHDQAGSQQYGLNALQAGYNTGNAAALSAAMFFPELAKSNLIGPQAVVQAGQGLTSSPWAALDQYRQAIGAGYAGSANTTSPYFQNQGADILSGLSGGLGIGKQLFGSSSSGGLLSGLFGGGGAASVGGDFGGGGAALGIADTGFAAPLAEEAAAAAAPATWIICTELIRQGRMPKRHYLAGISLFAAYPERFKRGYYLWSIPAVRHLRRYPNSRRSKFLAATACWRSENIAAKRGVRGARRLVRGMLVSAIFYPVCAMLGFFAAPQDWRSVYRDEEVAR